MYGKVMSIPDDGDMTYFRLLTAHHAAEWRPWRQGLADGTRSRATSRRGWPARSQAPARRRRGRRGRGALRPRVSPPRDGRGRSEPHPQPADLRAEACICRRPWSAGSRSARSEGRRRIQQGGVTLDGSTVTDSSVPADRLAGEPPQGRQVGHVPGRCPPRLDATQAPLRRLAACDDASQRRSRAARRNARHRSPAAALRQRSRRRPRPLPARPRAPRAPPAGTAALARRPPALPALGFRAHAPRAPDGRSRRAPTRCSTTSARARPTCARCGASSCASTSTRRSTS